MYIIPLPPCLNYSNIISVLIRDLFYFTAIEFLTLNLHISFSKPP